MCYGTEFFQFDAIRDALALINEPGVPTITNAKPYNGAGKPIESLFSEVQSFISPVMEGYVGGDRMKRKTQSLGRPMPPYSGSFEEFEVEFQNRLLDMSMQLVGSGPFKGRAPRQILIDHVQMGWRPVRIHPSSLDSAFARRTPRQVDRGAVKIDNFRWFHPDLPTGEPLEIALPWRRGARPLVLLPSGWAALEPELAFNPKERDGAVITGRRQTAHNRRVTTLARSAGKIDLAANLNDRLRQVPKLPALGRVHEVLTGSDLPDFGAAYQLADASAADQRTDAERRKAREDRITQRLLKEQGYAA